MPRNESGQYVKPPGTTAVPNTTIASAPYNALQDDMADALTESLPRTGVAPMLASLPMNGNKITGLADGSDPGDAVNKSQLDAARGLATYADLRSAVGAGGVTVFGRDNPGDGGGGFFIWRGGDQSANVTDDPFAGIWVAPDSDGTGASGAWERLFDRSMPLSVEWWGGYGDGVDRYANIQAALDYVQLILAGASSGGELRFGWTSQSYNLGSNTLLIKANSVTISGVNKRASKIISTGDVIGNDGTSARFYVNIKHLFLATSGNNTRCLDFTYFKNSRFESLIAEIVGSNCSCFYGRGTEEGASPYYNTFIDCDAAATGATSGGTRGWHFAKFTTSGGSARGPNSNTILGGRAANCSESISIQAGNNNTFQDVWSESVKASGYDVVLGDATADFTGTATGGASSSLSDSGANFSGVVNGAVYITGGTGAGQVRKIASHTATSVQTKTPWDTIPNNTSVYQIFAPTADTNVIINPRSEGTTSKAGFLRNRGGTYQNTVIGAHVSSLGSGDLINDDIFDFADNFQFSGLKPLQKYTFYQNNVAASQSAVLINAVADTSEYMVPTDGHIVAISVRSNANRSAGSFTVVPAIDGTAVAGFSATLDSSNPRQVTQVASFKSQPLGGRGKALGVRITSTSAWAPTTADIVVDVWVAPRN